MSDDHGNPSPIRSYRRALQDGAEQGRRLLRSQTFAMHAGIARSTRGHVLRTEGWVAHLLASNYDCLNLRGGTFPSREL